MSYYTWNTGINGSWGTAADWNGGVPNSTTADVTITVTGSYTVSLASATTDTVDSVVLNNGEVEFVLSGTLDLAGSLASFTFDGNEFVLDSVGSLSGGVLDIDSGTLLDDGGYITVAEFILGAGAQLALNGEALTLGGTAEFDGGLLSGDGGAGNYLVITGAADINSATSLEDNATLVDAGIISDSSNLYIGNSSIDSSAIVIDTGAIFNMTSNNGIVENGTSTISNSGLFEVTGAGGDQVTPFFDNTGTIFVAAGDDLILSGGGLLAGSLTGNGEIDLTGGTFTLSPTLAVQVGALGLDGAVIALAGDASLANATSNGGIIALDGYNLTLAGTFSLQQTVEGDNSTLGGNMVVVTGSLLMNDENVYVEDGATLVDAGIITEIDDRYLGTGLNLGSGNGDSGTLLINSGATYNLESYSDHGDYYNTALAISENGDGTGFVYNYGTFNVSDVYDTNHDIGAAFNNYGILNIASNTPFNLLAGGTIGGVVQGEGYLALADGNYTLASNLTMSAGTFDIQNVNVALSGDLSISSYFILEGNSVTTALNGHILTVDDGQLGADNDHSDPVISGPGTIELTGSVKIENLALANNVTLINLGTSQVAPAPERANIVSDGTTTFDNQGLLEITTPPDPGIGESELQAVNSKINNSGTIVAVAGSDLQLSGGGTIGGTLAGAGEIDLTGGTFTILPTLVDNVSVFDLAGGALDVMDGSTFGALAVTGSGANISLNVGAAVTLSGPLALAPGATLEVAGGTLVVEGSISLSGALTESGADLYDNGALVNNCTITLDPSTLTVQGNLTGTGVTTLGSGSTLDVTGDISAGQTIVFAGSSAVLQITSTADVAGTLAGAGTIDITDLPFTDFISASFNSVTDLLGITFTGAASPLELNGDFAFDILSEQSDGGTGTELVESLCYLHGTRILTPTGQIAVEALKIGDAVVTRFGAIQRIKWLGRQSFAPHFIANNPEKWPVCIQAGALAEGTPACNLYVSPGHSMLLGETLVLASRLVNGVTVTQTRPETEVNYVQLELVAHDCVIAEGTWSETYADGPGLRAQFHNAAEYETLYPDEPPATELRLCAERPEKGPKLAAALLPVVARAGAELAHGPLEGWLEVVSDWQLEGWAMDQLHPTLPVMLEVWLGERSLGTVLACDFRADLRQAGKGRGYCAFSFTPPFRLKPEDGCRLSIRRPLDDAELPLLREPVAKMSSQLTSVFHGSAVG